MVHFDIHANQHVDPFGIEYDYKSVMHYGETDYSFDSVSTVLTPNVTSAVIGQRTGGSYLDYTLINLMYGCYGKFASGNISVDVIKESIEYFYQLQD